MGMTYERLKGALIGDDEIIVGAAGEIEHSGGDEHHFLLLRRAGLYGVVEISTAGLPAPEDMERWVRNMREETLWGTARQVREYLDSPYWREVWGYTPVGQVFLNRALGALAWDCECTIHVL